MSFTVNTVEEDLLFKVLLFFAKVGPKCMKRI